MDGSVDAIIDTLNTYRSQKCRLSIISYGVGEVTLNDIETAKLFNGLYSIYYNQFFYYVYFRFHQFSLFYRLHKIMYDNSKYIMLSYI